MIRKEEVYQFPKRVEIFLAVKSKINSHAEIKENGVTLWINNSPFLLRDRQRLNEGKHGKPLEL